MSQAIFFYLYKYLWKQLRYGKKLSTEFKRLFTTLKENGLLNE